MPVWAEAALRVRAQRTELTTKGHPQSKEEPQGERQLPFLPPGEGELPGQPQPQLPSSDGGRLTGTPRVPQNPPPAEVWIHPQCLRLGLAGVSSAVLFPWPKGRGLLPFSRLPGTLDPRPTPRQAMPPPSIPRSFLRPLCCREWEIPEPLPSAQPASTALAAARSSGSGPHSPPCEPEACCPLSPPAATTHLGPVLLSVQHHPPFASARSPPPRRRRLIQDAGPPRLQAPPSPALTTFHRRGLTYRAPTSESPPHQTHPAGVGVSYRWSYCNISGTDI